MLLQRIFAHLRFLESSMQQVLNEIEAQMDPYQEVVELLMTHPGVQAVAAMGFVSEVGIDLSRFPSAKHFASWVGVCPGNHTSAGKRKHGKTTKGNTYLRALLAEIVWGMSHTKDNYVSAHYHRLARRIGRHQSDRGGLPHSGSELLSYDHQTSSVSGTRSELL
jgi:transposase